MGWLLIWVGYSVDEFRPARLSSFADHLDADFSRRARGTLMGSRWFDFARSGAVPASLAKNYYVARGSRSVACRDQSWRGGIARVRNQREVKQRHRD